MRWFTREPGVIAPPPAALRWTRADAIFAALIGAGAAAYAFALSVFVHDQLLTSGAAWNFWFHADPARVFANVTDRLSDQSRANVHPLFPLIGYTPVEALTLLGAPDGLAVRIMVGVHAGLLVALQFALLRLMTLPRLDAALLSAVLAASAAFTFFAPIPETFALGGATILACLCTALLQRPPAWAWIAAGVAALGVTLTNISAWGAGALVRLKPQRIALYAVSILIVVAAGWAAQKLVFPSAGAVIEAIDNEPHYMLHPHGGGPVERARAFFLHAIVSPDLVVDETPGAPKISVQRAPLLNGGGLGLAAAALWIGLLGFGAYRLARSRRRLALKRMLALALGVQFALHLVYGEETILYALHWSGLLIAVAGFGALGAARPIVLAGAGALAVLAAANNVEIFLEANRIYEARVAGAP